MNEKIEIMTSIEFWENFGYWRDRLNDIYAHIKSGMTEEENPFCRKGIIVEKTAGMESRFDFVLDYLKVSELMEEGKVSELAITDDWDEDILPSANNENSRECWNTIINRAFEVKDGLLPERYADWSSSYTTALIKKRNRVHTAKRDMDSTVRKDILQFVVLYLYTASMENISHLGNS